MRPSLRAAVVAILLSTPLVSAGCDRGAGAAPETATTSADTTALEGLTREQIERQVQPMSPGEARQRGIADSVAAAAVEQPEPGAAAVPRPGAVRDSARPDTTR